MSRLLLAAGARGRLVKILQSALAFEARDIDGVFASQTADAVKAFQKAHTLAPTGEVDTDAWTGITHLPVPTVEERALALTADFEGHGFELAQGNFDGAGITWGIVGFTLKHGEIGKIVHEVQARRPDLVQLAFGDLAPRLLEIIDAPRVAQLAFADSLSLPPKKALLAEPWRSAFHLFGSIAEVQQAQIRRAHEDYFQPAMATAGKLKLASELGVALAFDIHVQNGGVKPAIQKDLLARALAGERDRRLALANAVADSSSSAYKEDVRSRKVAIAQGGGLVHGANFVLKNWGLDERF